MDKKSILAMVLIAIIIILLPYYQKLITGDQQPHRPVLKKELERDTLSAHQPKPEIAQQPVRDSNLIQEKTAAETEAAALIPAFNIAQDSVERTITIQSNKFRAVISNRGGGQLQEFVLNRYPKFDSNKVNMIDNSLSNGLNLSFQNAKGDFFNGSDYLFRSNHPGTKKFLEAGQIFEVSYDLQINGDKLLKKYIFYEDRYHFDVVIQFSNPAQMLLNRRYDFGWQNGLPASEAYLSDDYSYSQAYVHMGDELEGYSLSDAGKKELVSLSGTADWLAVRIKYFLAAIINKNADVSEGVYFSGEGLPKEDYIQRLYNFGFNVRYVNDLGGDTLRVYLGPLDNEELDAYENNLDDLIMNNGWYERTFRFISLLILPVLEFLYGLIPNYGLVIIVFSLFIKILVHPLTKKSYSSMKEMQTIQPLMAEIREKYKDDAQRMNKEMMKLYKEHGVNPFGGCLPLLLQMPLLIALFIVFRSTIQLRGAMFIPGWITDLSRPDTLFLLPFSLPLYGNEFNILPILMALTMIFQSKMSMQDPKQKAMIYLMPIFMLLIFNRFPSGLNLYYTMFNLLTIIQQKFFTGGLSKKEKVKPNKLKK